MRPYFRLLPLPLLLAISACLSDRGPAPAAKQGPYVQLTDSALFAEGIAKAGHRWQRGDSALVPSQRGSGHGFNSTTRRIRYNALAWAALTDSGRLPKEGRFPEGSLIVKEIYDRDGNHALTAIMKKAPRDTNAALGWVWAEYYADRPEYVLLTDKGRLCTSCHGASHRDFTLAE